MPACFYLVLVNLLLHGLHASQLRSLLETAYDPPTAMAGQQQLQQGKRQSKKQVSDLLQVLGVQQAPDPKDAGLKAQGDVLPNIVDVLGHLPSVPSLAERGQQNRTRGITVAICSTGHLRTFSLPGMYSSLSENLLKGVPGMYFKADLYLVGHLGRFAGNGDSEKSVEMDGPATADDGQLAQARDHLGLSSDHVEHTSGNCTALEESWARDGITGRQCTENGNYMQMMWLDHCVRTVRSSGENYDLLVRTRPDIGIFQAFPWDKVPTDRVAYMEKEPDGFSKVDWFFTVPWPTIDTWWDPIAEYYATGFDGMPDHNIFGPMTPWQISGAWWQKGHVAGELLTEMNFPVVIVRGPRAAQCMRIVSSPELQADCEKKTADGYWEQFHEHTGWSWFR